MTKFLPLLGAGPQLSSANVQRNFTRFAVALLCLFWINANAQLSVTVTGGGNTTPNLSASYTSLANAVTALNAITTISGPVTLSCTGSETAPAGGYNISFSATTTLGNNIVINGNSTSTVTASGSLTAGSLTDALFKLVGVSYITLENFTMKENSANTTTAVASNNMTEWGVALLASSATKGSQNNTIQGNTITLGSTYLNTFGVYSNTNHTATSITTLNGVNAATGENGGNKIYSNTISSVNVPICFSGNSTYMDNANDIGGSSLSTANICTNWGVGTTASAFYYAPGYSASTPYQGPSGIFLFNQTSYNASYNTLTSNVVPAGTNCWGINAYYLVAPSGTFTNTISGNTISVSSASTSIYNLWGIESYSGVNTMTLNITNNKIQNCAISGASSTATFYGIMNLAGNINTLTITGNNLSSGNSTTATSGNFYGIYNTGTCTNAITINTDTIGETFSAVNTGTSYGIYNANGAATATLQINSNVFQNFSYTNASNSTNTLYFIDNAGATLNQSISSNNFNNISIAKETGNVYLINNVNLGGAGTKAVNNNVVTTGFSCASGTLYVYNESGSSTAGSTLQYENNNFSNISSTGATSAINGMICIDGSTSNKTISGNTISLSAGSGTIYGMEIQGGTTNSVTGNTIGSISGTGTIYGIYSPSASGTTNNISSNTFSGISTTSVGGTIYVIGTGPGAAVHNIYSNTINGVSIAQGTVYGIYCVTTGASSAYQNSVSGITNGGNSASYSVFAIYVSNSTAACAVYQNTVFNCTSVGGPLYGIYVSQATGITTNKVYQNTIYGLTVTTGTAGSIVAGMEVIGGGTTSACAVYQNKIYGLSGALDEAIGLQDGGQGTNTYYNNVIGNLSSTATSVGGPYLPVIGIAETLNGSTGTKAVYFNTVYLNGALTGAGISAAFYTYASATSATCNVALTDNILVNDMTPATGAAYAVYRNGAQFNNVNSATNNNLFYSSSAGSGGNMMYGGSAMTYATYKADEEAIAGNTTVDNASINTINEANYFLSTVGSSTNYLNLNPASSGTDGCYNAGVANSTITVTDYLSLPRAPHSLNASYQGTASNPTIGAYEVTLFNYDAGVTNFTLGGCASASPQNVQAVITNFGLTTLTTVDVTWYVNGVSQGTVPFTGLSVASGATTTLTLGTYTFTGGAYTIRANTTLPDGQTDQNPTNDTASQTYSFGLSGTYTVGASGYNFTNLTAAIAAYNAAPICGAVVFQLESNYAAASETFPLHIRNNTGASSTNTLTIEPASGVTQTISGNSSSEIFWLDTAQYVKINGSSGGSGTGKNLTITNTSATASTILLQNGTVGDNIKNCIINGNATTTGIIDISTASATAANNNDSIINNIITTYTASTATYGIYNLGTSAALANTGTVINSDSIYGLVTAGIDDAGNSNNEQITNNNIFNFGTYGTEIASAGLVSIKSNSIFYNTSVSLATQYGVYITKMPISAPADSVIGNYIGGSSAQAGGTWTNTFSGATVVGIYSSYATTAYLNVLSNTISNFALSSTGSNNFYGIEIVSGEAYLGNASGSGNTISYITLGTSSTTTGNNTLYGIWADGTGYAQKVMFNTIKNLTVWTGTGTATYAYGILYQATGTPDSIIGNTIDTISSKSLAPLDISNSASVNYHNASVMGVEIDGVTTSLYCGANTIYNLINNAGSSTTDPAVVGIGSDVNLTSSYFYDNKIYDLENNSTYGTTLPGIAGMRFTTMSTGYFNCFNNQVILTNSPGGTAQTNTVRIYGITDQTGCTATGSNYNNYYFNSVYIGGSTAATTGISSCWDLSKTSTRIQVENNLLYNVRTTAATATGFNYAMSVMSGGVVPATFTSNYNELYSTGNASNYIGIKGSNKSTSISTFAGYAPAGDGSSKNAQVWFNQSNPPTTDLTPSQYSNCALWHTGTAITSGNFPPAAAGTGVMYDYNGTSDTRNNPPDLGAIEFANYYANFTAGPSQSACVGGSVTLAGTQPSSDGMATSVWSPITGGLTYSPKDSTYNATLTGYASGSNTLTWSVTDGSCIESANVVITGNPLPVFTTTPTEPSCNGYSNGQISVSVSVGTSPYSYSLNGGSSYPYSASPITGLSASAYSVVVKDFNGCISAPSTVNLGQPSAISTPAISETDALCSGGTGTVTVTTISTGGTGTIQYSLNGGTLQTSTTFSGVATGISYTVVASDANGCTSSTSNSVTVNAPSTITTPVISETDPLCNGGTGTVTVTTISTGGTGTIQYSLNGGAPQTSTTFSGVAAGTSYTVVASDANGCTSLTSNSVTVNAPLALSAGASNTGSYFTGQTISISSSSSGGTGSDSYRWSGPLSFTSQHQDTSWANATAGMGGTYTVTVTDGNGCTATASTDVVVTPTTTYTWTGANGTSWSASNNWSPTAPVGGPNSCSADVVIPLVASQPIVSSAVSVGNLQIDDNVMLTLNASLSLCKNWTGGSSTGATVTGNSLVILNGFTTQAISGKTQFNELQLNNSNGAILNTGSDVSLVTSLDLPNGTFDASLGNLTFLSAAINQVAIIDNFTPGYTGTLTGNITVQRYYSNAAPLSYKQHFFGSPVNAPSLSQFGVSGTQGYVTPLATCDETQIHSGSAYGSLFSYHENNGTACEESQWYVETSGNAVNGLGYSVVKPGNGTLQLIGTPNLNTSYAVGSLDNSAWNNVSLQGHHYSSGWQLLANPYLASLKLTTANPGFDNQVQVWHANGAFAASYQPEVVGTGNDTIAPFEAFMVHVTNPSSGNTYTIKATDRVRTAYTFFEQNDNQLDILATNMGNGLMDKTTVAFNNSATDGFDPQFDADKFPGALSRHTLYTTLSDGHWMARNILNSVSATSTVAMGFEPGANGTYKFSFNGLSSFDPTTYIFLEDKQQSKWVDLRSGDYTFTSDSSDNWERFVLHFTPPMQIQTTNAGCVTMGAITAIQPGASNWNYQLIGPGNINIASGVINQTNPLNVNVPAGSYALTLTDNNGYTVTKSIQVQGAEGLGASFAAPVSAQAQTPVSFVSTATNATDYSWNFGDGSVVAGISTPVYTYSQPGVYTVTLTVKNSMGCMASVSETITVTGAATGLNPVENTGAVNMWSNANRVYVDFSAVNNVDAVIRIYNILGQEISNDKFTLNALYQKEIDQVDAAYVIVSVKNNDNITTRKLFIISSK